MIAVVFLYFLTDVVGFSPAFAGFILMVGTLWDAISDPTIGILSDRSRSSWGRRRPFILASVIPYALATWLLFSDFGLAEPAREIYFVLAIIGYYSAATLLEVPYTSLTAEMTRDYDERADLLSYRAIFSQVGSIIGASSPWVLVAWFSNLYGDTKTGWTLTAALFGIISIFPILWTWHATRGHELDTQPVDFNIREIWSGPLQNRPFLYAMAMFAAANVALGASGSIAVYYMKYYMHFDESQQSMAYLFLFAFTVFWIPVINIVTRRFGKRASFIFFVGLWALIQAIGMLLLQPGMIITFYVFMTISSAGIVSVSLTGLSMIPDTIEVDEFKTGQRREGLYFGVNMFMRKFWVALALWIIGTTLSLIGYVPDQEQSETTLMGIRVLYSQGTAAVLFLSIGLAYLLPMTRSRHDALRHAITLKQQGKEWDNATIKQLL
jgi:sugar (glycoside-pentoside-hexuronide) transporter